MATSHVNPPERDVSQASKQTSSGSPAVDLSTFAHSRAPSSIPETGVVSATGTVSATQRRTQVPYIPYHRRPTTAHPGCSGAWRAMDRSTFDNVPVPVPPHTRTPRVSLTGCPCPWSRASYTTHARTQTSVSQSAHTPDDPTCSGCHIGFSTTPRDTSPTHDARRCWA